MTYSQLHGRGFSKPATDIIRLLISNPDFCYCFFYCRKLSKKFLYDGEPCDISHVRDAIIDKVYSLYNYKLTPEDCSTFLYETIWDEGTFKPLDSYNYTGSFEGWLYKVGLNAVVARLKIEGLIPRVIGRNAANTRLTLLSQSTGVCERVIDDLISDTQDHRLLTALYVDRLSEQEAMKLMEMDKPEFDSIRKAAEHSLKMALLRENHPFRDFVLHDKSAAAAARIVTLDEVLGSSTSDAPSAYAYIFGDVLGTNLEISDISARVAAFLKSFVLELKWSQEDCRLWCERFINNTAPTALARELCRTRDWVDHRFSSLNKKFKLAIRKWWQLNAA